MNLSGILVMTSPNSVHDMAATLDAMPTLEVHQIEHDTGRIIVVQEAEDVDQEIEGLKAIKKLPGIILAEMVYHYFAEDEKSTIKIKPEDLDAMQGMTYQVPAYLNE